MQDQIGSQTNLSRSLDRLVVLQVLMLSFSSVPFERLDSDYEELNQDH